MNEITTETEYEAALKEIDCLMGLADRREELDRLVKTVQAYESDKYPIGPPSADGAKKFRMDQERMAIK